MMCSDMRLFDQCSWTSHNSEGGGSVLGYSQGLLTQLLVYTCRWLYRCVHRALHPDASTVCPADSNGQRIASVAYHIEIFCSFVKLLHHWSLSLYYSCFFIFIFHFCCHRNICAHTRKNLSPELVSSYSQSLAHRVSPDLTTNLCLLIILIDLCHCYYVDTSK